MCGRSEKLENTNIEGTRAFSLKGHFTCRSAATDVPALPAESRHLWTREVKRTWGIDDERATPLYLLGLRRTNKCFGLVVGIWTSYEPGIEIGRLKTNPDVS